MVLQVRGKTTYATNIAYEAIKMNKNCVYFSLEMSAYDMYIKWLSRHSFNKHIRIEHRDIKLHKLDEDNRRYLFEDIYIDLKNTYKPHLHIVDETQIYSYTTDGFSVLLNDIDKLFIEETGHGIDVVFVDHIQLLKFDESNRKTTSETTIINYWVDYFRKQCMNFLNTKRQIVIILLSQANREGWKNAKHENRKKGIVAGNYELTALAEANELERASSMVISVFTSDPLKAIRQAKVQLLKCRDGQTMEDAVCVFADLAYYAFGDKAEQEQNGMFDTGYSITNNTNDDEDSESQDNTLNDIDLFGENDLF